MRIQAFAVGLALAWAAIGVARADDVRFTISGGDGITTFELPLNPTPSNPAPNVLFTLSSVSATVRGSLTTFPSVTFWAAGMGGGFTAGGLFDFKTAPQFYAGSEDNPEFKTGPAGVVSYKGLLNSDTGQYDTLTVKDLPSDPPPVVSDPPPITVSDPPDPPAVAAPELTTWAMLLLGFFGMGYAGYRKSRTRTIS
jgi:hypothetical protein